MKLFVVLSLVALAAARPGYPYSAAGGPIFQGNGFNGGVFVDQETKGLKCIMCDRGQSCVQLIVSVLE